MRLLPTLLLVYIVLGIQSGISPFVAAGGASPNLLLGVVIFIALYARREDALIGCFIAGLLQDMLSQAPLGVHPLAYALVAMIIRMTQPALQRSHWVTNIIAVIAGASAHAVVLYLVSLRIPPRYSSETLMNLAIYSSIIAIVLLRILIGCRRLFVIPVTASTSGFASSKG